MSVRIHQFIDALKSGRYGASCSAGLTVMGHAKSELVENCQNAICFEAGNLIDLEHIQPISEICRAPFDTCWIEIQCRDWHTCFLVYDGGVDRFSGAAFVYAKNRASWISVFIFGQENGAVDVPYDSEMPIEGVEFAVNLVRSFFTLLNCKGIKKTKHYPSALWNKKLIKKRKTPIFSYWTLDIDRPESEKSGIGAKSGSPRRLHLRRGHFRRYAPGKYCRVHPHTVGDKRLGIVHKDYRANRPWAEKVSA